VVDDPKTNESASEAAVPFATETTVAPQPVPAKEPEQEPAKVRDFWPTTRKRALILTILMQFVVVLVTGLSLIFAGFDPARIEFMMVLIAVLATSLGVNVLLLTLVLAPLKDLSDALTHVSGEPSDIVAPNSTSPARRYDGLGPLLQLIYRLDSQSTSSSSSKNDTPDQLTTALEQSPAGLVICDEQGIVRFASKHAPIRTDANGQLEIELLFSPETSFTDWLHECQQKHVHSSKTWLRVPDKRMGDPDRRIFDVLVSYEKGSSAPVVLVTFDQTEHYRPEDDQLDFISFAAHELRGPVTVIRGYLDVFREELQQPSGNPVERTMLLERLIVSANRLSGYIANILNASRYDRQHLVIHLREYNLAQIYAMIADDMNLRATTQNRLLSVTIPPELPTVAADPSTLSEVFSNLIDNAIKYSNEGGTVTVTAAVEDDFVRVQVIDQGVGMPANVVGNLFHKFYRSHRSREAVSGTGIGLYISKAIVDAHGGVIEVKSEEGKGSLFSFSVPIYATVADKLSAAGNTNTSIIRTANQGWIKNHAKYRS
jgi:signal transduction histidine kinase